MPNSETSNGGLRAIKAGLWIIIYLLIKMKCPECGKETPERSYPASCAGAEAEERAQNVNLAVKGTNGLPSCYCCDACRHKCIESWSEENESTL